jgi:hypothetical protein
MRYWLEDAYWRRHRNIKIRQVADSSITQESARTKIPETTGNTSTAPAYEHLIANLQAVPGVFDTGLTSQILSIQYDLRKITLREIKIIIAEHDLSAKENFWERCLSFIGQYKEAVRREEQLIDYGWDTWVQDSYVSRYKLRRHGRRDDRLTNWRQYEQDYQTDVGGVAESHVQASEKMQPHER